MPCLAFCLQVIVNDLWASQSRAKVGGRTWAVFTMIADLESPSEALQEVMNEVTIRVTFYEGREEL